MILIYASNAARCRRRLMSAGRRLMVSEREPPAQKGRSGCGAVDSLPTRSRAQPPHGVSKQRVSQQTSRSRRLTLPLSYHFKITSLQGLVRRRTSVLHFALFRNIFRVFLAINLSVWHLFTQYYCVKAERLTIPRRRYKPLKTHAHQQLFRVEIFFAWDFV